MSMLVKKKEANYNGNINHYEPEDVKEYIIFKAFSGKKETEMERILEELDRKAQDVVYEEFAGEELVAALKKQNPDKKHPRLLVDKDFFAQVAKKKETDSFVKTVWERLEKEVQEALAIPASVYDIYDGIRLNAGKTLNRVKLFALFFRVTGEKKYLEAAWAELESASAFPDFNPYHFLDTATMCAGLGIGYDWLYEYLTEDQRQTIRTALIEKGLKVVMIDFLDQPRRRSFDWCHGKVIDNWTFVCCGGVSMGALAIADDEGEELCGEVLSQALHNMERAFWMFAPDGAWVEGSAYWDYATLYYSYHLASLQTALGSDCGRFKEPGLQKCVDFLEAMNGPAGNFNFSDNGAAGCIRPAQMLWFAHKLNRPELGKGRIEAVMNGAEADIRDLIWYDQEFFTVVGRELPLDSYFPTIETVTMRSCWDADALYVGFHGGKNGETHAHLDVGSFVLDALGERFFLDLGRDDYNLPGGVFNRYRYRAEGHNTLVIGPDSGYDQQLSGYGNMICFESSEVQNTAAVSEAEGCDVRAVCDMTPAYSHKAKRVTRLVRMINSRSAVIVEDDICLEAPQELYWFGHTCADIVISQDGREAILTQNNKQLRVNLLAGEGLIFSVMDPKPLPDTPVIAGQAQNEGVRKLTIHGEHFAGGKVAVSFEPIR